MSTAWAPAPEDLEAYRATETAPASRMTLRLEGPDPIRFAKNDPDLIVGMAVCKPGLFNGVVQVTRDDLDAWVARFEELRGVFRPPLRVDHSWSILEVIGRYEALRVENRPDATIGGAVVPMLVADVRLVGTREEKRLTRERIEGDKFNERSSEFWPYRTNAGAEYPSVFAGCAFVDIPAVEGLGPITLRRATLSATPEEDSVSDTTPTDDVVETPPTGDTVTPADGDVDAVVTPSEEDADETPTEGDDDATEGDDDEGPVGEVPPAGTFAAQLRAAAGDPVELERIMQAEADRRATLRVHAETTLAKHTERGVVTPAVRPHVEAMLRHDDPAVRDAVTALLEAAHPPVKLGAAVGTVGAGSTPAPVGEGATTLVHLHMERDEVAEAWANATPEQRQQYRHELTAWQAAQTTGA